MRVPLSYVWHEKKIMLKKQFINGTVFILHRFPITRIFCLISELSPIFIKRV